MVSRRSVTTSFYMLFVGGQTTFQKLPILLSAKEYEIWIKKIIGDQNGIRFTPISTNGKLKIWKVG